MSIQQTTNPKTFILNCEPSINQQEDWNYDDALDAGVVEPNAQIPESIDLREDWWGVDSQGSSGECVGYSTAYGLLRWHYTKNGNIDSSELPSVRFITIANKESDNLTRFPTTFLEMRGTQIKRALGIVQKYGCVLEDDLPKQGASSYMSKGAFYAKASRLRISSYHNLGKNIDQWCQWLAFNGPLLARLNVDDTWDRARDNDGFLGNYKKDTVRGGNAVCLVGYDRNNFIIRNNWGESWGDGGYAYATYEYVSAAITETYGVVI